jgi:hypothetical protein
LIVAPVAHARASLPSLCENAAVSRRLVFASTALGFGLAVLGAACSIVTTIPDLTSGPRDASATGDANGDAGSGDAASGFCRSQSPAPMFCDDFDDETSPFPRWEPGPDGQKIIDSRAARSQPSSLRSSVPAGGPDCARATVKKRLEGDFRAARVSLAVRFDDPAELDGYTAVMAQEFLVQVGSNSDSCQAILLLHPTMPPRVFEQVITSFPDGGASTPPGTNHDMKKTIAAGEWHVIDIDHDRRTGHLRVLVDGKLEIDEPLQSVCALGDAPADLQVGLFCMDPRARESAVRIDDVSFDAR